MFVDFVNVLESNESVHYLVNEQKEKKSTF